MTHAKRVIGWIFDRRWWCAAACAIVTAVAAWHATSVGVDNSLEIWFVGDDPALVSYRKFQQAFGSDEVVVVAFSNAGGMLNRPGVELLESAAERVRGVDGVAGAYSIADVPGAESLPDRDGPGTQADARRSSLLGDPLVRNRLASADGTVALLVVQMQALADMDVRRDVILAQIDAALAELKVPYNKAGIGVLYAALNRLAIVDASVLFLAAWGLVALVLWCLYRRLAPVAIALGIVATASLWTLGLYGACGRSLNMVTSAMPTLVLVIGVAECVHIQLHVGAVPAGCDRRTHVVRSLAFMLRPCLINLLTTVAGLASLAASPLPVIRDLGVFSALGLVGCFVLTFVGCAWALAWKRSEPAHVESQFLQRAVDFLAALGMRRPGVTLAAGFALVVVMAAGASRVSVDTFTMDFLFRDHPVRRDSDLIESRVGPYVPLEFVVRSPGGELDPGLSGAVERWRREAEARTSVGWSHLLVDESGALRVTFGIRMQSARSVERIIAALVEAAALPGGAVAEPAGYLPLYVRMVDYVVSSQVQSFTLAFVTIFVIIGVAFRSARAALFAIPANLVPVLVILGVMGYAGIRVDVATVTIASVVLALVVDDTVHVLHRLHHELGQRWTPEAAVRATLDTAGRAIVVTTLVLVAGFSVFAAAGIKSVIWFGLLIALGLIAGLVADLLLMPALVLLLCRRSAATAGDTHFRRFADGTRRHG